MKKHLIYAIACIAAVFSLTSCFSDNGNDYLTDEEIYTVINDLSYEYQGYLVPVEVDQLMGTQEMQDSVMTSIYVGRDTTLTIYDFPIGPIADKITLDSSLKEALQNAGDYAYLYGNYVPANTNPSIAWISYLSFQLQYSDGNSHEITLAPDSYSYIAYSSTENEFYFQFTPTAIYVDGILAESFSTGYVYTLYYLISSK